MKKRRLEILALAALILLAAIDRPSITVSPDVRIADLIPERIDTARDVGRVAVRLLIAWID